MLARLLMLGAIAATALMLLALGVRHELHVIADRDTRPCPECRSLAVSGGVALTDEQGHRLRFATPELAAQYAADYASWTPPTSSGAQDGTSHEDTATRTLPLGRRRDDAGALTSQP